MRHCRILNSLRCRILSSSYAFESGLKMVFQSLVHFLARQALTLIIKVSCRGRVVRLVKSSTMLGDIQRVEVWVAMICICIFNNYWDSFLVLLTLLIPNLGIKFNTHSLWGLFSVSALVSIKSYCVCLLFSNTSYEAEYTNKERDKQN